MRFVEVVPPDQVHLLTGPSRPPGPGEARIRVTACGICGTDLHLLHGMVLPAGAAYPVRPGHEVAGEVVELGPPPDRDDDGDPGAGAVGGAVAVGDAVALHPLLPCGRCPDCRAGQEQRCPDGRVLGIHEPGGMADEITWPVRRLVPTGTLPAPQAALLPDAVATAHHALAQAGLPPGGTLAVVGAGGVGTHALQLARALDPDARLAAVVRSEASARRLEALHLDLVLQGLDGAGRALARALGPVDAVLEFSGHPAAAGEAVRAVRRGGTVVLGSVIDEPVDLGTTTTGITTREVTVRGSYTSALADLRAVADLAATGALDLSASASVVLSLDDAAEGFRLLEARPPGLVRAVIVP